MLGMHLTGDELALAASGVAAIAVIVGSLNNASTNRNQLKLALLAARRDDIRRTYELLLEGVHYRAVLINDSANRPAGHEPRFPSDVKIDLAAEDETIFAVKVAAYASPEVRKLWEALGAKTADINGTLTNMRSGTGDQPPAATGNADVKKRLDDRIREWVKVRDELEIRIRKELSW
jgi:hypothetical protein